jgi:hypothetical protein
LIARNPILREERIATAAAPPRDGTMGGVMAMTGYGHESGRFQIIGALHMVL